MRAGGAAFNRWRRGPIAALLVLLVAVGGCSNLGVAVAEVSLADLATDEARWDGRLVRTVGLVLTWEEPRHYWIEDAAPHRVEIVPHDAVAQLVGQLVEVEGAFSYSEEQGRRLTVSRVELADER